jgi:hypothetical protein
MGSIFSFKNANYQLMKIDCSMFANNGIYLWPQILTTKILNYVKL